MVAPESIILDKIWIAIYLIDMEPKYKPRDKMPLKPAFKLFFAITCVVAYALLVHQPPMAFPSACIGAAFGWLWNERRRNIQDIERDYGPY